MATPYASAKPDAGAGLPSISYIPIVEPDGLNFAEPAAPEIGCPDVAGRRIDGDPTERIKEAGVVGRFGQGFGQRAP